MVQSVKGKVIILTLKHPHRPSNIRVSKLVLLFCLFFMFKWIWWGRYWYWWYWYWWYQYWWYWRYWPDHLPHLRWWSASHPPPAAANNFHEKSKTSRIIFLIFLLVFFILLFIVIHLDGRGRGGRCDRGVSWGARVGCWPHLSWHCHCYHHENHEQHHRHHHCHCHHHRHDDDVAHLHSASLPLFTKSAAPAWEKSFKICKFFSLKEKDFYNSKFLSPLQ